MIIVKETMSQTRCRPIGELAGTGGKGQESRPDFKQIQQSHMEALNLNVSIQATPDVVKRH